MSPGARHPRLVEPGEFKVRPALVEVATHLDPLPPPGRAVVLPSMRSDLWWTLITIAGFALVMLAGCEGAAPSDAPPVGGARACSWPAELCCVPPPSLGVVSLGEIAVAGPRVEQ